VTAGTLSGAQGGQGEPGQGGPVQDGPGKPVQGGGGPVQGGRGGPVQGGSGAGVPANDWPAWTGVLVLAAALVVAAVASLIVDIPALALGVKVTSSPTPPGIVLGDTFVQDIGFVLTPILFAGFGGRAVYAWQLGYRPTRARRAAGLVVLMIAAFLLFNLAWSEALDVSTKEKLLEQLGANETALLLVLSALLTTVVAPIAEETLFRGYIFGALSKWRGWLPAAAITGILFGGVHATSAPAADLLPLMVLGFALCWLYRSTGSLLPCIAAHSLNNSLAFGSLEGWGLWQTGLLMLGAMLVLAVGAVILRETGVLSLDRALWGVQRSA
jgi:CAAX protease family protein